MKRPERSLESYRDRHLEAHRRGAGMPPENQGSFRQRFFENKLLRHWWLLTIGLVLALLAFVLAPTLVRTFSTMFLKAFHAPWGLPTEERLIIRPAYLLDFDEETKLLRWIGFRVQPGEKIEVAVPRLDPEIKASLQEPRVCKDLEQYECARLVASKLVAGAKNAGMDISYYSAMAPLTTTLNRSLMKELDYKVEKAVGTENRVWVLIGPIYRDSSNRGIPSHFFYIYIVDTDDGPPIPNSYILPQEPAEGVSLPDCEGSLADIEALTGLDLFPKADWIETP